VTFFFAKISCNSLKIRFVPNLLYFTWCVYCLALGRKGPGLTLRGNCSEPSSLRLRGSSAKVSISDGTRRPKTGHKERSGHRVLLLCGLLLLDYVLAEGDTSLPGALAVVPCLIVLSLSIIFDRLRKHFINVCFIYTKGIIRIRYTLQH
jgi:hypothetical protein